MPARCFRRPLVSCWLCLCLLLAGGCGEQPQIRSYEVTRPTGSSSHSASNMAMPAASVPTRMIAAMIPRASEAWFIKVMGPEAAVGEVTDQVLAFIDSVELVEGDPNAIHWRPPAEWKDGGTKPMREATYLLPVGDPPLEVAISKLGFQGDIESYVRININRWRGQLDLADMAEMDEAAGVSEIDLGGKPAWLFDAAGAASGDGMQPPMMGRAAPFAGGRMSPPSPAVPPAPSARPELQFETPSDWVELERGLMGSRSYQLGEGQLQAVAKLSDFPPVGSMADPAANIDRWRRQLSVAPLGDQPVDEVTEAVTIGPADGVMTLITSPDESQAMLAAMVVHLNHVWFFQLSGAPEAVAAHRDEFVEWLGTVDMHSANAAVEGE